MYYFRSFLVTFFIILNIFGYSYIVASIRNIEDVMARHDQEIKNLRLENMRLSTKIELLTTTIE